MSRFSRGPHNKDIPAHFKRVRINVAGTEIEARQYGHGPDLLFLHGAPGSMQDWGPVAALLPEGFRITLIDRPGYGNSGPPAGRVKLASNRGLVQELMTSLGLQKPIVIGHSYGASIALALACGDDGDFAGFVTVGGPAFGYSHALFSSQLMALPLIGGGIASLAARLTPYGLIRRQLERALGPETDAVDEDFYHSRIREWRSTLVLTTFAREEVSLNRELKALSACYSRIETPVALVQGGDDVYIGVDEARRLGDVLPNSRLYISAARGHYLQFGQPELIVSAIMDIIRFPRAFQKELMIL